MVEFGRAGVARCRRAWCPSNGDQCVHPRDHAHLGVLGLELLGGVDPSVFLPEENALAGVVGGFIALPLFHGDSGELEHVFNIRIREGAVGARVGAAGVDASRDDRPRGLGGGTRGSGGGGGAGGTPRKTCRH